MPTIKELDAQLGEVVIFQERQVQVVGIAPEDGDVGGTYILPGTKSKPLNPTKYYPRTGLLEHQPTTKRGTTPEDTYLLTGHPNPNLRPAFGRDWVHVQFVHARFDDFRRP